MEVNYFWGSLILGFIINIVTGYFAFKVVCFIDGWLVSNRINDEIVNILCVVGFVSSFIFVDYIAVTKIFANREVMLESIIITLVGIVIGIAMTGYLGEDGIGTVIIWYLCIILCTVFIWKGYHEIRTKSVYESNIVINVTPVVIEEQYELLEINGK